MPKIGNCSCNLKFYIQCNNGDLGKNKKLDYVWVIGTKEDFALIFGNHWEMN